MNIVNLSGFVASIPSPSGDSFSIGPLTFRAYGLMIAFGVFAAIWLSGRLMKQRGIHPDVASQLAIGGVIGGIIGARLYHVITDWRSFEGRWGDAWKIWEGGLGIPGGIALGAVGAVILAKRQNYPLPPLFDAAAPALPLAQAIGRLGNWFNQELFGRPTDLPWGLEIDPSNRPREFVESDTFHPTFLYEGLWNIGLMFLLLWLYKKRTLRTGRLFYVYMGGYAIGRLWIELMRSDFAYKVFGVRVNIWTMLLILAVAVIGLVTSGRRREGEDGLGRVPGDPGYGELPGDERSAVAVEPIDPDAADDDDDDATDDADVDADDRAADDGDNDADGDDRAADDGDNDADGDDGTQSADDGKRSKKRSLVGKAADATKDATNDAADKAADIIDSGADDLP